MPNPFPGMDPYLEGPLWPTVHNNLVEEIARQLAPKLRPKYLALTSERVVVSLPDELELGQRQIRIPDVGIFYKSGSAGTALGTELSAPLVLEALVPEEIRQTFVEIRDVADRKLVTCIEVLSLTNKRGDGLSEFKQKRQEILAGPTHYLEIDLLRTGERFPVASVLPFLPYFVFLSRAGRRPRIEVWPIAFEQPLPTIAVPLLKSDGDISLDLQLAMQSIYELFGYDQAVDHSQPPMVPLSAEQQAWADRLLQARAPS